MKQDAKTYAAPAGLLDDRVVLVTGAGDGIGRALALRCASLGARVVLLGRTSSKLEAVYDEIIAAEHPRPSICPFDLAEPDPDKHAAIAQAIEQEFDRLDGLVHNAGILGNRSPIEHYPPEVWQQVMAINVTGPFLLTRACLPLLRKTPSASIIFTSSGVGRSGRAYWGAYAASKFAIEGLMEVLADELENFDVRVNSVNPGKTRTAMRRAAYPAEDPETLPAPDAVLAPFIYLLGPDSADVTGQAFDAQ